jgi:pantothenate kinase type III
LFNQTANLAILAKLNADESTKTRTVWADHTKAAISGGTMFSVAGGVEKIISIMEQRFTNEVPKDAAVESVETVIVFTGGDAELVMQHMDAELQSCRVHCSNLVFEGMRLIAQQSMALPDSTAV